MTDDPSSGRHEEYMRRYMGVQTPLRAYVLSLVRDFHVMEDVLQEVAVAAWRLYGTYDPARPFLPWVLGIARNKSVDAARARKTASLLPTDVLEQLSEEASAVSEELAERRGALADCIQKLGPTLRAVLQNRVDQNLSVETIAARHGKSANAVRKLLARARAFLAECTGRAVSPEAG